MTLIAGTDQRSAGGWCPSCHTRAPGAAARALAAELAIPWLTPDPDRPDGIRETRHCRRCAPTGPVTEIACRICSDGPLLTGGLAGPALHAWLHTRGWQPGPTPSWTCPDCPAPRRPSPR